MVKNNSKNNSVSQVQSIAVIGGGAAGFFAAIRCASVAPRHEVYLLEATRRPLTKVKISGGGRCNVTHHCFDPVQLIKNYPRGSQELRGPFSRFQPQDTVRWFGERGVTLKAEADGRMFPTSNDSQTVIDCLRGEAERQGVRLTLGAMVRRIEVRESEAEAKRFTLHMQDGSTTHFDKLLLATGSAPGGYDLVRSLGHKIDHLVPSLFTFNINDDARLKDLAGIAFPQVGLRLSFKSSQEQLSQTGPMLITHWGLSGPAVLKLSAFGARPLFQDSYKAELHINFLPTQTRDQVLKELMLFKEQNHRKQVAKNEPPSVGVPRRFWERLVMVSGMPEMMTWAEAGKKHLTKLASELTEGLYQVDGKGVFKEEFVTCGGVNLQEVDFRTMESRLCPGLYFAGEILDIDGITGGFNFQNAWTTGWIAGTAMAGLAQDSLT